MQYREIVSVTGIGGLYHLITTKSDGAVVRSLSDKSTKFISARKHNITPLESIEIYTINDNVRLQDVLLKMKEAESNTPPVDAKKASSADITAYFKTVYPELDEERVYISDMKKMLKWYIILRDSDLLNFEVMEEEVAEEATTEAEEAVEEKPAKKATKKKAATKKSADADGEEKPAKKTATKKKAATKKSADADGEEKPAKKTAKKKTEE